MHRHRRILTGLLVIVLLAIGGGLIWASTPLAPMPEAINALRPDDHVVVQTKPWLVFQPVDSSAPSTGLVIYPGGRVDPRAYAPTAHAIASHGYLVVIVPMPLNLAVLGSDSATSVMSGFPEVERWAIGGHSLGGAMAARYAHNNSEAVNGLVLWAAYPSQSDGLDDRELAVVSIYASEDGLATIDKINASRPLLPPSSRWVLINGGNHAQFGWYGSQDGDGEATIGRNDQQAQVVEATVELLRLLARIE